MHEASAPSTPPSTPPAADQPALAGHDLVRAFDDTTAVDHLTVQVRPGELVGRVADFPHPVYQLRTDQLADQLADQPREAS